MAIIIMVIQKISIKLAVIVLITVTSLAVPVTSFAQNYSNCGLISRNLKIGMSGDDVLQIQVLLNSDPKTTVSSVGPGSKGFETTYFGVKTHAAIIQFQELYDKEVLLPVHLTTGSGFVGMYTRLKLLTICSQLLKAQSSVSVATMPTVVTTPASSAAAVIQTNKDTTQLPAQTAIQAPQTLNNALALAQSSTSTVNEAPQMNSPSSYVVVPGTKVTISGAGFTPTGNAVHVGSLLFSELASNSSASVSLSIPLDSPRGKFDLWVSNDNGESNKSFLIIVEPGTRPPLISSFSPMSGVEGTLVTVTGERFTPENNEIYFGSKPSAGISSSDGKTLVFRVVLDIPGMEPWQTRSSGPSDKTMPVWFYVVNANGISGNGIFTLGF